MRIAVDARPLASPLTGIGRYTRAMLDAMVARGHQWFLYSDRPLQVAIPSNPRLWARHGDAVGGTPGSLRWAQWQYPRWAVQDVVDLFWSPRHHLPLSLNRRIASVVTIHDLVWRQFPETMRPKNLWLERMLMGPSIRTADRVICVSRFTASEVSRYYPSAVGKCQVVHEAAAENVALTRPAISLPENYLLFVGTLEPRKNLPRLLNAYASLQEDAAIPPLVIVGGEGWGNENLSGRIEALGLSGRVTLCGYVSDAELQAIYAGAHCLLMPSLYEGFGLPVLEAMQHGVPVIASSTSSLPEVAGDAGLLINPYSVPELAAAIRQIVHDKELHAELSKRAQDRAEHFSWQRAAEETLQLFEETLADHQPRAYRHRYLDDLAR
ncbi:MAG: glycosyltransferase family 1 protein [Halieaceae bacterium]|nr:glycosyltransferase family 1 protein [Halieaceae bacterium]